MFFAPFRLLCVTLVTSLLLSPGVILAQSEEAPTQSEVASTFTPDPNAVMECPIGAVGTELDIDTTDVFGTELNGTIGLTNGSAYTRGGVRVAIGLFSSADAAAPVYWSVIGDTNQLDPQSQSDIEFALDTAGVPAGEYTLGVAAFQGDVPAAFGALVRNGATPDQTFVKTEEATDGSQVSMRVNGSAGTEDVTLDYREQIEMAIVTTNEGATPLLDSSMVTTLTQGTVPLGAAVARSGTDSVKLIPGGSRTTEVVEPFLKTGVYTAYAALSTPGQFQPVMSTTIQVTSEFPSAEDTVWPYISSVGASAYPASDADLVACIASVGEAEPRDGIAGPLAVDFVVADGDHTAFRKTVEAAGTGNKSALYVEDVPLPVDAIVRATLHTERFAGEVVSDEAAETQNESEINLSPVQTVEQQLRCIGEVCGTPPPSAPIASANSSAEGEQSFWYYAGIVLTAALLGYLMLRRLHPEEKSRPDADESVELQ